MKTRLLKKVRKDYKILEFENDHYKYWKVYYKNNVVKYMRYDFFSVYVRFKEMYNFEDCIDEIIKRLRFKYRNLGHYNRSRKFRSKKVWWEK